MRRNNGGNVIPLREGIEELRGEVNEIDAELLALIAERRRITAHLGRTKAASGISIRDLHREREVLEQRRLRARELGLDESAVEKIFEEILTDSVALQEKMCGEMERHDGKLSRRVGAAALPLQDAEFMAHRLAPNSTRPIEIFPFPDLLSLITALNERVIDEALLPIEHSTGGVLSDAFETLSRSRLSVLGEEKLPIEGGAFLRVLLVTRKENLAAPIHARGGLSRSPDRVQFPLASRARRQEGTVIDVRGVQIGGGDFVVIAGPCSVESYDQIMVCAREVKVHGGTILRGGCFKSRTSPYSFQGLGFEGLEYLVDAGRAFGLPVITEVLASEDVERVAACADIIQIGARNMQNFALLKAVGRVDRPVMLKRGMSSSIDELLLAVEYILAHGNERVIICERGIRTFETRTRSTLDISAIPVLKRETHLPVIVDPSHAAGDRDLVPALALAAKAVGADGIMVEVHPDPEHALSDGPQSLRFNQYEAMMKALGQGV